MASVEPAFSRPSRLSSRDPRKPCPASGLSTQSLGSAVTQAHGQAHGLRPAGLSARPCPAHNLPRPAPVRAVPISFCPVHRSPPHKTHETSSRHAISKNIFFPLSLSSLSTYPKSPQILISDSTPPLCYFFCRKEKKPMPQTPPRFQNRARLRGFFPANPYSSTNTLSKTAQICAVSMRPVEKFLRLPSPSTRIKISLSR